MAELADAHGSDPCSITETVGSNPTPGTEQNKSGLKRYKMQNKNGNLNGKGVGLPAGRQGKREFSRVGK